MSTAPRNTSYHALYRACMKAAAAQGRSLMMRLVARAADSMKRRAAATPDESERKLLADAWRTLMKHEGALCETYPQALLNEFAQTIAGSARKPGAVSFDSLELMGDEQMQESVEQLRNQRAVLAQLETELAELTAFISAVQGLESAQEERNPLRPEVYVRSLRQVTLQSPVPAPVRVCWLHHLGEALGPELARVYGDLCGMLRSQGVVQARFTTIPAPAGSWQGATGSAPPAADRAGTLLNMKELRRLLSGATEDCAADAGDAAEDSADSPDFAATVPAALETLEEMRQVDQVMKRVKERRAGGPRQVGGAALARERWRDEARGTAQALSLEVVNLMVENIAGDQRLLPPVQQAVRDLEPALLRLALGDPRFFSDRKHPARSLLDQMTQRSLAWESVDAPGFGAFIEPLQQAVDALVSTRTLGTEPFDYAVKKLEQAWATQQQRDGQHREKAVRALLQAEQRHLLAEKLSREMRARTEAAKATREIAAFLAGPWSQVMAQARLADASGASDPGGYAGVVSELLWSTQPRLAGANRGRLMKLIPGLVERLRHGLATIDFPGSSTKRFLDELARTHGLAMKAPDSAGRPASLATTMTREELEALLGDDEGPGPWLGPTEAQHSGFMTFPQPLFEATPPAASEAMASPDALAPGLAEGGVQPGAWVEMSIDGRWARYQLAWASPHGTLFMFTGIAGKPCSMTRHLLEKMLKTGMLRMISGQAVVDGALDAVARTALRNSVESRR